MRRVGFRRALSTAAGRAKAFGIVFDLDGVLIRGKTAIPGAKQAYLKVLEAKVPHCFLTNGGGITEEKKAWQLAKILELPAEAIDPKRMILAHTPMQNLASKFKDRLVLIVGGESSAIRACAEKYGFNKFLTCDEFARENPHLNPLFKYSVPPTRRYPHDRIEAVLVFYESFNWFQDLQIIIDVLLTNGKAAFLHPPNSPDDVKIHCQPDTLRVSHEESVEVYFSNPDMVYGSVFALPRFGQGAFRNCILHLYEQFSRGKQLTFTSYGKPNPIAYRFAEQILLNQLDLNPTTGRSTPELFQKIYAIGDNPASDVCGANAAGQNWFSILTRTGVFKDGENDQNFPAKKVCHDLSEAVDFIFDQQLV